MFTIPLSAIQLYDWISKTSENKLVAIVNYGVFHIPTNIMLKFMLNVETINSISELWGLDPAVEELRKKTVNADERHLISKTLNSVILFLRQNIPDKNQINDLSDIKGYWMVRVINRGDKAVSSVLIRLPNSKIVSVGEIKKHDIRYIGDEAIHLEIIQPQEEVSLFAWTITAPTEYDVGKIKLTHNAGVGKIYAFVPTGKLGQWVEKYAGLILWIIIGPIIIVGIKFLLEKLTKNSSGAEQNEKSGAAEFQKDSKQK